MHFQARISVASQTTPPTAPTRYLLNLKGDHAWISDMSGLEIWSGWVHDLPNYEEIAEFACSADQALFVNSIVSKWNKKFTNNAKG
jgi:hypothetical protein